MKRASLPLRVQAVVAAQFDDHDEDCFGSNCDYAESILCQLPPAADMPPHRQKGYEAIGLRRRGRRRKKEVRRKRLCISQQTRRPSPGCYHLLTERCGASELARLCFPPHHGRGECCKRMIVQAHRVAFSLAGKTQDATCELVRPYLVIAVAPESQPSLVERCFQGWERLGIKLSAAKSTHVSSPEQDLAGIGSIGSFPLMWLTL